MLPTATPGLKGLSIGLAFYTASSFISNTNLQHYVGDQQLSVLSQMIAITFTAVFHASFVIAFSPTMHFSYSSGSRCCYPKANAV
jgi:K+-transporting ATPase A subunit